MAGVGEAAAIVGLIDTAAQLSKAVIDIASRYKNARRQIETFGREVDHLQAEAGVYSVTVTILDQCTDLLSELDVYKDALYSSPGSVRNLTFRGKTKWVFEAAELEYLWARLESMKTNMLLMMTMQCLHDSDRQALPLAQRLRTILLTSHMDQSVQRLSIQSNAWVRRLENLEKEIMMPSSTGCGPAVDWMSIRVVDTAESARSIRDSILSLYGHQSYYEKILDPRNRVLAMALETETDHSRASNFIECHLDKGSLAYDAGPSVIHEQGSDEDDEDERNNSTSPITHTDDGIKVADSDLSPTESTPTMISHRIDPSKPSHNTNVIDWTAGQCADYIPGLGLPQSSERFLKKGITGRDLIHMGLEGLGIMGINSTGIRLMILKGVHDVKVKHNISIGIHDWIPSGLAFLLVRPLSPTAIGALEQTSPTHTFTSTLSTPLCEPEDTDNPIGALPSCHKYRAKAIRSYQANPDEPDEISFAKGEILEVSDVTNCWWVVEKARGEKGIAPSNHLFSM